MKIRFNNFLKLKTRDKKNFRNNKCVKEPVLKVYSGNGEVIKYESYKFNNKCNKDEKRKRKGAENRKCEVNTKIVKKYKDDEEDDVGKTCKMKRNLKSRAYLLFLSMIILAGYSLYFSYSRYKDLNQEAFVVYNSVEKEIEKIEEQSSVSNNLDTIVTEESIKTSSNLPNTSSKVKVQKIAPLNFSRPLEGEISKIYSKDKVIYSKTLELWKTHDGIDIKADENAIVKSIEKGTVEKIYNDSFYGKTIVIDHGQGYKSCYSNLGEDIFVKEKQVVTKLAKIGKVGKTAIGEIKDESHLHFTLIKNNEICDPSSIFN